MKTLKEYLMPNLDVIYFEDDAIRTSGNNGFDEDENELPMVPIFYSNNFSN